MSIEARRSPTNEDLSLSPDSERTLPPSSCLCPRPRPSSRPRLGADECRLLLLLAMSDRDPEAHTPPPGPGSRGAAGGGDGEGNGGARCGGSGRREGVDRWEDRHEAEGEGANRREEGAHRPPRRPSPQRPRPSPDLPLALSVPRSEPHHPPEHTTSTTPALHANASPPPLLSPRPSPPMHPRSLLPLLHCRLCPSPALLHAPVTLHCGHTFCAAHLAPPPDTPSTSRAADASFSLPRCPLPDCSSSSRAPATFSHSPPLDVTVNKLLELLSAPDVQDTPSLVYQDDQDDRTDSEYEVDSDSDLEYLPLPPISPTSSTSQRASSSGRDSHSEERVPSSSPPSVASRHHSRSRSQPSPRLHPRKRRRRLHGRVSPSQPRPQPHRTDHDRQTHLEKELLSELTCEICFGLLWQPITTPCQHTFCTRCLFRSFDHSQTCPLCRQKLPAYDYFQHHPCNKVILDIIRNAFPDAYAERGATIEAEERDARLDTPIFVCQLSFPGMPTMLHFFEPRYRLMLRRCLDSPHPCFGMIPPPRSAPSSTAGASSTGNDYGTMLAIRNVQMLPDGRSLVETWGTWRFRIMERGTLDGYTVARIERIEDYEEELDDGAVPPGEFSADDRREGGLAQDTAGHDPSGPRVAATSRVDPARAEAQLEAAVRAELRNTAVDTQTASPSSARSHPGAIHTPPASSEPTERPSHRRDHEPHTRPGDNGVSEDKVAEGSRATSGPSQAPRAPTNAELMAKCHAFIDQMREGTPWVVQHLNNNYVPMPSDPASFSFWMALLLPIDEHEKAKLLPIRSPRLRLRLVVHWIEQLNSNWAHAYASASAWQVVLWRVRHLLAQAVPPRALRFWMWLVAYAVVLAAIFVAQTLQDRGGVTGTVSEGSIEGVSELGG